MNNLITILGIGINLTTHLSASAVIHDSIRFTTMIAIIPLLWLISQIYKLIPIMGRVAFLIIDNATITQIYHRVEIVLGIFMIFKLTIEFAKMLANPDLIQDKEKGLGNIFKKIFVSLALLAITPFIFKEAYVIQNRVLEDNLIGKLIMINSGNTSMNSTTLDQYGREIAWYTLNSFYYNDDPAEPCRTWWVAGPQISDETMMNDIVMWSNYNNALLCTVSKKNDTIVLTYDYSMVFFPLLSLVFSIYILWLLLSYALALGLRAVQLAFLQIISPIPILSYISKKDG